MKFPGMIVKPTSPSRVLRGLKKNQLLKRKADSLLRSGIQCELLATSQHWTRSNIGNNPTTRQADDIPVLPPSKRQRIRVVRDFTPEDPKSRWLKRGRYAILEKRDERRRAWKTGNKSFFIGSSSAKSCISFYPFPAIVQSSDFNFNNHVTTENASFSELSNLEDVMDSEKTPSTVLLTIESTTSTETHQKSTTAVQESSCCPKNMEVDEEAPIPASNVQLAKMNQPATPSKTTNILSPPKNKSSRPVYSLPLPPLVSPPPSIKIDVFRSSKLRVPAPSTPKSSSPTISTTTIVELTHKAQVSSPKEAQGMFPPFPTPQNSIQSPPDTPSDSPSPTETPITGENIINLQAQAPEPQKEDEKPIQEMTLEELDAVINKALHDVRTEAIIKDMGTLFT